MRLLLFAIFVLSCSDAKERPSLVANQGSQTRASTQANSNLGDDERAQLDPTNDSGGANFGGEYPNSTSSPEPAAESKAPAESSSDTSISEESVTAPTNINGAYLSCVIDDDRIPNGVVVDCLLLGSSKEPLAVEGAGLEVEYSIDLGPKVTSVVTINQSSSEGAEFIFEAADEKESLGDVMMSTFRAKAISQSSGKAVSDVSAKGQDLFSEFIKSTVGAFLPSFPSSP